MAVIHYPVYDKRKDVVATSLTNLEIHDIARTCMTFGINLCYIVTPLAKQRDIAARLIEHWIRGYGSTYNPVRGEALRKVKVLSSIEEMVTELGGSGVPMIVGTSSRERPGKAIGYQELKTLSECGNRPVVVVFGTGWGLTDQVIDSCDKMLDPIRGNGDYNHLSLRMAIGIILDRIFGERGGRNE